MISEIVAAVLVRIGAAIFAYLTEQNAKRKADAIADHEAQAKVDAIKTALTEAQDGSPVTKEQRAKLNSAFRDLVRGGPSNGV